MKNIKIVLQCEGAAQVLVGNVKGQLTVGEALVALGAKDIGQDGQWVFAEDRDESVDLHTPVQTLVSHKGEGDAAVLRLHQGRCKRVTVNVSFNGITKSRDLPPVTRVARVHQWATQKAFDMSPRDAAEHVLELVGGDDRPDPDTQIGTLTSCTLCSAAFDLVPFKRVEG